MLVFLLFGWIFCDEFFKSLRSYYPTLVPIAVILQLIVFISFGAIGDFGSMRKRALVFCATTGALCVFLFSVVSDASFAFGGFLLVASNVLFGFSIVMYNAFMPLLVANLPDVRNAPPAARESIETARNHRVSANGFIIGYTGGVVLLIINVAVGFGTKSSCSQWCRDCPTMNGTAALPGWNAYDYDPPAGLFNKTLSQERVYCNLEAGRDCSAWPGATPPCGLNSDGLSII